MPARRSGGGHTIRRKHSLGNLRRAHPASGATWNVQVVRGKMSSKCLWHACRALILGLALMLLGAGMATIGYYADQLTMNAELRANGTVRLKNDLKGFHLNNFSYVGPIVMGVGGFIVVASCVMTFEARDSAAKVVPARLRAGGGNKSTIRSTQGSAASQRRAMGMQMQSIRWDQQFGVFRSSPGEQPQPPQKPLDREALTAELIQFSKSLSASARFSPQLRRLTHTGSVPNLSTFAHHPLAYTTNVSHLLSPHHKQLLIAEPKRHHRHHHQRHHRHHHMSSSGRHVKSRGTRISNSLVQRATRETTAPTCALLQPPSNRIYWHASSFDESGRIEKQISRHLERTKRSDTAKRHVLARQKPIEHEDDMKATGSPLGNRRCSTLSDSSYSGRWTVRCASIASRTSSIDSRRIQVDMHSPEVMPKSILRSPKRYSSGPSATPSVEKEFRSQLSVCSEPPAAVRQLSGQSSLEPCFPEENADISEEKLSTPPTAIELVSRPGSLPRAGEVTFAGQDQIVRKPGILKKPRPDTLPITTEPNATTTATTNTTTINAAVSAVSVASVAATTTYDKFLNRSNSSRTFYRPKPNIAKDNDDSIFYIRSGERKTMTTNNEFYDSLRVINERRNTLLKADSETALIGPKPGSVSLLQGIPEKLPDNSANVVVDIETDPNEKKSVTTVDIESSKDIN